MKYIILLILCLSTLIFSGCHFSAWDFGWVTENRTAKFGLIDTDLNYDNTLRELDDKQFIEEDIKDQGFILGIRIDRDF